MIHRPQRGKLHDTWMIVHPDTRLYHLFYLYYPEDVAGYPPGGYRSINHVVSEDAVNWSLVENIVPAQSNGRRVGTGMTFAAAGDFYMTYTYHPDHTVYLMKARDRSGMTGWEMVSENPILRAVAPWYETRETTSSVTTTHFRDGFVVERDGAYHALATARSVGDPTGANGCVFHAVSRNLVHWEARPPLAHGLGHFQMEVPDWFELNGRHYILFADTSRLLRYDTPTRRRVTGTFYAVGSRFEGPYSTPADRLLLGSGCGRRDNYVGRHMRDGEEHLLYHHHLGVRGTFGLPKVLRASPEGHLSAGAWEKGIARLRRSRLDLGAGPVPHEPSDIPLATWQGSGESHRGVCAVGGLHATWPQWTTDVEMSGQVRVSDGAKAGFLFRYQPQAGTGILVSVDTRTRTCTIEGLSSTDGFDLTETLDEAVIPDLASTIDLRCLSRAEFLEVYLQERVVFSASLEGVPESGYLGLYVAGGEARFEQVTCHALTPLVPMPMPVK